MAVTTPCREWQGPKNQGYGIKWCGDVKRTDRVHRWVMAQIHGWDAIRGRVVCHHCDNPACYRYDHLFIGTIADNTADRDRKNRQAKGEESGRAKLTEQDVREIRANPPGHWELRATARAYGVHHMTIKAILDGRTWKHVS